MRFKIFISSVQSEFADERRQLATYIRQDALLERFFDVFIFEETLEMKVLKALYFEAKTKYQLAAETGCSLKSGNFKWLFRRLLNDNLIQMTHPDAARRHGQQYRLSDKSIKLLSPSNTSP